MNEYLVSMERVTCEEPTSGIRLATGRASGLKTLAKSGPMVF